MNGRERIAQVLFLLTAMFAIANGNVMLIDPFGWYDFVGTVKATGPANGHFIRDIGLAYIISGIIIVTAVAEPRERSDRAIIGGAWLLFHGILHIYEVISGICSPDIFWRDAPGVLGPPLLLIIGLVILKSEPQNTD